MKVRLYSIRDKKSGFLPPTSDVNDETATRNFHFACQTRDKMFMAYPDDYDLFYVGEYDTESGIINPCNPMFVASARNAFLKDVKADV